MAACKRSPSSRCAPSPNAFASHERLCAGNSPTAVETDSAQQRQNRVIVEDERVDDMRERQLVEISLENRVIRKGYKFE